MNKLRLITGVFQLEMVQAFLHGSEKQWFCAQLKAFLNGMAGPQSKKGQKVGEKQHFLVDLK